MQTNVDDLHRLTFVRVPEPSLVHLVERASDRRVAALGRPIDTQVEGLASIAHVQRPSQVNLAFFESFAHQLGDGEPFHLLERRLHAARVFVGPQHDGPGIAPGGIGDGDAQGREHAGVARDEHGGHPKRFGKFTGVLGAGAAERHQREIAWVVSPLQRYRPQRAFHHRIRDLDDPERGTMLVCAHVGQRSAYSGRCTASVDGHSTA